MKSIIESSVYLLIMAIICTISIDFISINKSICKGQELQQYVKDTIIIYGLSLADHKIDDNTHERINNLADKYNSEINIIYFDTVNENDYYTVNIIYPIISGIFNIKKTCSYNSIIAVKQKDKI